MDGERGVLTSFDGRELPFDLLVTVPLHGEPWLETAWDLLRELG